MPHAINDQHHHTLHIPPGEATFAAHISELDAPSRRSAPEPPRLLLAPSACLVVIRKRDVTMYRRSDPRWNRTLQHLTSNIEHANESAQENIYGFTQRYVNPCLSSITQCVNVCSAPCFPSHNDRRRRRTPRGRAESSFDFYDDWEEDENDGLLGWGSENLDRFLGSASTYGTTSQPGRQSAMSYGQRSRDARYDAGRRKSHVQARDVGGQDPTIIPSSSYFGFLGRLPFKIGGKGLRYRPSAADLTEHPGASRRSMEEEQPLIEESDEDALGRSEHKDHRRQRSDTHTSGHTTDSLSSRGDIFPSEDELDDAVPLDDEFTLVLERRTTGQWNEESGSNKKSSSNSKRPSGTRVSTRSASSRSTRESAAKRSSEIFKEIPVPTLDELQKEEERLRIEEEQQVHRKRQEAQHLAVQRGLVADQQKLKTPPSLQSGSTPRSPSPQPPSQMSTVQSTVSPLVRSPATEYPPSLDVAPFPSFVDAQTMPESSSFHVDESDYSSLAPTPRRPLSLKDETRESGKEDGFVPARLPNFGSGK
ncbi:hypothetical protein BDU57DRAFT_520241 [Ampelomyces quisqualis]|uniref:Uncharacterized protein n=1 Tax=Ampelomyces quisqualis TaxID=50730 RepID=A0A6A5QKG6_AMPQU|nr:hypothetical protein BDU57DRAFT_520241 [Ampelomyces quisqualis]